MLDPTKPQITYFSSPEIVEIKQDVQVMDKGWCTFQGTLWACQLRQTSLASIGAGEKAIAIGRKGTTLLIQALAIDR
ncbi:MAG: hypothetical protein F6K30_15530 [Cyanothece sp. SIO2G6]|nr:hypothetical protein [Cyanothece sp. SIO2G6]